MARINISGVEIEYDLVGDAGAQAVAITPGGRFPKDTPGLPELAKELAAGGRRVLLWDRPGCGASDISFNAGNESELHAATLMQLIRELELGPTALAAGSAGSRVSLLAAAHNPDCVSHLLLWWISGGMLSMITIAGYYCGDSAIAASKGGMEAVAALPAWALQIARNPKNRDIILSQDPTQFIATMERWALALLPPDNSPVPGITPEDFARLRMPAKIYRSGVSDFSHPRATSEWVHALLPNAELAEPPWPDDEWNRRSIDTEKTGSGLFVGWPALAPDILEFTRGD
ncbi:MAG: 2-hydroxy-6-oxonona-2,4-dienedioate hydrolase [Bermanella sp.]|jgi:2-hydroxy-6-oxonona-2,4-dienedioate hydrolase